MQRQRTAGHSLELHIASSRAVTPLEASRAWHEEAAHQVAREGHPRSASTRWAGAGAALAPPAQEARRGAAASWRRPLSNGQSRPSSRRAPRARLLVRPLVVRTIAAGRQGDRPCACRSRCAGAGRCKRHWFGFVGTEARHRPMCAHGVRWPYEGVNCLSKVGTARQWTCSRFTEHAKVRSGPVESNFSRCEMRSSEG